MNAPDHKAVNEALDALEHFAVTSKPTKFARDHACIIRAELEKLRQRFEAADADARQMAKWIGRVAADNPTFHRDHACAQCVPYSDIIKPGFVCAIHTAAAIDRAGGGERENGDG
jgi:hypothetical protein